MVLSVAIILGIVGFLIFYNRNKSEKSQQNIINGAPAPAAVPQTTKMDKQGVKIEILKKGAGEAAKNGDIVSVHYTGTLENGTKFDSSVDRGVPFEFTLGAGQVISGWDIGVEGMKIGEVRKLTISSELAYGASGAGNSIPPNATLIFEVRLLGIK